MFAWHTEDLNLSSINYMHYGNPKFWYCVSPKDHKKLEGYVKTKYPEAFLECPEYLRHKTVLVNPYELKRHYPGIELHKLAEKTSAERGRVRDHLFLRLPPGL